MKFVHSDTAAEENGTCLCETCWQVARDEYETAARKPKREQPVCGSGWTGDRCTYPLFHDGEHSNP